MCNMEDREYSKNIVSNAAYLAHIKKLFVKLFLKTERRDDAYTFALQ